MIPNNTNINTIYSLIEKSGNSSLTAQEQLLLSQWVEQNDDNLDTYQRLKAIHALKRLGASEIGYNDKKKRELIETVTRSRRRMMFILRSTAAAVLLLCAGVGGYYWIENANINNKVIVSAATESISNSGIKILKNDKVINLEKKYEGDDITYSLDKDKKELSLQQIGAVPSSLSEKIRIVVERGYQYKITLPDSSTVWLNSSSEIAYSTFTDSVRCVELKGEACFDVTRDVKRPFVVKLEHGNDVTVLGTVFNVKSYDDEPTTKVALIAGSVRVNTKTGKVLLEPNKEVVIDDKSGATEIKKLLNKNCIAWIDGGFVYENECFENIVRELSRRYNRQFIIHNENIKRERFTMNIPKSSLIDVISYLKNAGRGLYTIEFKEGEISIL